MFLLILLGFDISLYFFFYFVVWAFIVCKKLGGFYRDTILKLPSLCFLFLCSEIERKERISLTQIYVEFFLCFSRLNINNSANCLSTARWQYTGRDQRTSHQQKESHLHSFSFSVTWLSMYVIDWRACFIVLCFRSYFRFFICILFLFKSLVIVVWLKLSDCTKFNLSFM